MKIIGTGSLAGIGKSVIETADRILHKGKYKTKEIHEVTPNAPALSKAMLAAQEGQVNPAHRQPNPLTAKKMKKQFSKLTTKDRRTENDKSDPKVAPEKHSMPKALLKDLKTADTDRDNPNIMDPSKFVFSPRRDGSFENIPKVQFDKLRAGCKLDESRRDNWRADVACEFHKAKMRGSKCALSEEKEIGVLKQVKDQYALDQILKYTMGEDGHFHTKMYGGEEVTQRQFANLKKSAAVDKVFTDQRQEMMVYDAVGKAADKLAELTQKKTRLEKLIGKLVSVINSLQKTTVFEGHRLPQNVADNMIGFFTGLAEKSHIASKAVTQQIPEAERKLREAESRLNSFLYGPQSEELSHTAAAVHLNKVTGLENSNESYEMADLTEASLFQPEPEYGFGNLELEFIDSDDTGADAVMGEDEGDTSV